MISTAQLNANHEATVNRRIDAMVRTWFVLQSATYAGDTDFIDLARDKFNKALGAVRSYGWTDEVIENKFRDARENAFVGSFARELLGN